MNRRPTSLATRITALCLLIAVVTVVVAGVTADRLITGTAVDVNRQTLSEQADGVAELIRPEDYDRPLLGIPRVVKAMRGQDVAIVVRYRDGEYAQSGKTARTAARRAGLDRATVARPGSELVTVDGRELQVETRGLQPGLSFALVREVRLGDTAGTLVQNVAYALAIGLAVAGAAGLLLSRVLSRPLRHTASVAAAMRTGRRDLRAPVGGAAEVAEVATSVNELADALRHSESRQRDFLLSVSHELRTPLTSIKGFAESLADGVAAEADTRRIGGTMLTEADRLERLVTDLLELARAGADDFRLDVTDVDAVRLTREAAEVWGPRCARRGIDLTVEVPGIAATVRADPRRLRQVLDILLDNACRLTPSGAPLVLAVRSTPSGVTWQVRDGGPGLDETDYAVAFEPGALHERYRGRRQGGSGIGLALAHRLVSRMGGDLTAGPAPEGGAAFTLGFERSLPNPNTSPAALEHPAGNVDTRNRPRHRKGKAVRPRNILLALTGAVITALVVTVGFVWARADTGGIEGRPNILYFLVDDMSADLLPYMDTVNELAEGGARFDDYVVSNSLCCTSRATMFTGLHPHNSGVLSNKSEDHGGYEYFEPLEERTYAEAIHDTGDYRTGYLGKYINEYKMNRDYEVPPGWDEWHVADGGGYNEYDYRLSNHTGGRKRIGDGGGKYLVDVLAKRATGFIERSRDSGRSFFLQVAPFAPHSGVGEPGGGEPRFPPAKRDRPGGEFANGDCGGTDCADIDVTDLPAFDEDTADKPAWVREEPMSDKETAALNTDLRDRVRMLQSVDDMVERVTGYMTESERDDTYVMFGSDNGFHLGQHRLLRGKTTAYDTDARVPFLVKRPESLGGGNVEVDRIAQNTDIYPTLVDIANGDADGPTDTDGRSLLKLINGETESDWRDAALIGHYKSPKATKKNPDPDAEDVGPGNGNANPPSYTAIRTADALLVDYEGTSEMEFYDLRADPDQLDNRPDDPRIDALTEPLADLAACGEDGRPDCWEAAHVDTG